MHFHTADSSATNSKTESSNRHSDDQAISGVQPFENYATKRKFFVGGLKQETQEADLRQHFQQFGPVADVRITSNAITKVTRGFGFVTMATEEAKNAIFATKEHIINGKAVTLREIQENAGAEINRKIFVGGLAPMMTDDILTDYFSKYGKVESVKIITDDNGKSKGYGFVAFASEAICRKALDSPTMHNVTPTMKVEIRKVEHRPNPGFGSMQPPSSGLPPAPTTLGLPSQVLGEALKWNWRPGGSIYPAFEIDADCYTVVTDNEGKMYLQPSPTEYERLFREQASHPHLSPIANNTQITYVPPPQSPAQNYMPFKSQRGMHEKSSGAGNSTPLGPRRSTPY